MFLHKPFFVADVDRALHQALGLKMPGLANPPGDAPALAPGGAWFTERADAIYLEDVLKKRERPIGAKAESRTRRCGREPGALRRTWRSRLRHR